MIHCGSLLPRQPKSADDHGGQTAKTARTSRLPVIHGGSVLPVSETTSEFFTIGEDPSA